ACRPRRGIARCVAVGAGIGDAVRARVEDPLSRAQRRAPGCIRGAPGVVRAEAAPAPAARDLAARARHHRAWERASVGDVAGAGRLRRRQPRRTGKGARAPVVGGGGADRRPREDAEHRRADAALAARRPAEGVRRRRQHGRAGEPAPARAVPPPARRRGRVRRRHRLRAPVPRVPAARLRQALPRAAEGHGRRHAAGDGAPRGRRLADVGAVRVAAPQPDHVRAGDRDLARPARAVVEHEGRDRAGPGPADEAPVRARPASGAERARRRLSGLLAPLRRDAREHSPAACARRHGPAAAALADEGRLPLALRPLLPGAGAAGAATAAPRRRRRGVASGPPLTNRTLRAGRIERQKPTQGRDGVMSRVLSPRRRAALVLAVAGLAVGVAGASASGTLVAYNVYPLISDGSAVTAPASDASLVNGWGLSASATSPWWTSNNKTNTSTLYTGVGAKNALTVAVPGGPTGTVANSSTTAFVINQGNASGASRFLFDTQDGKILGWSPTVNGTAAVVAVDNSSKGALYDGLATLNDR